MINPEQNLVGEKMLLKELNVDADQLVLLVKITNVEQVKEVKRKEEKPEHLNWNKTKGYTVGLKGEDNMSWFDIIKSDKVIEDKIIAEFKKEGGALGMKNLKAIAPPKELKRVLDAMKRRKLIYVHEHGDLIMR